MNKIFNWKESTYKELETMAVEAIANHHEIAPNHINIQFIKEGDDFFDENDDKWEYPQTVVVFCYSIDNSETAHFLEAYYDSQCGEFCTFYFTQSTDDNLR